MTDAADRTERCKCTECTGPKPWHDPMGDIPPCENCGGRGYVTYRKASR